MLGFSQDKLFMLEEDSIMSGRGRSPYDPMSSCTSTLSGKTQLWDSCVCFCFELKDDFNDLTLHWFYKRFNTASLWPLFLNSKRGLALPSNKSPYIHQEESFILACTQTTGRMMELCVDSTTIHTRALRGTTGNSSMVGIQGIWIFKFV